MPPGLPVVRRPWLVAALAGATLLFWVGVLEAIYLLFFLGAMIQMAVMADWLKMLGNLDTGLLLLAGLLYAVPGLILGVVWWVLVSRLLSLMQGLKRRAFGTRADTLDLFRYPGILLLFLTGLHAVRTFLQEPSLAPLLPTLAIFVMLLIATFTRPQREARDFFDLFSYVGLSLFFTFCFVGLLWFGPRLNPAAAQLPLPVRAPVAALLSYIPFRAFFWLLNRILMLPVLRVLRRPLVHAVSAAVTVMALSALAVLPQRLTPTVPKPAAQQIFVPAQSPPIVFVVLDTCRADHFGCYGYPRPTTPNFDALARDSVLFMNAVSESPWTLPSHATMFTGLFPRSHGAKISHFHLDDRFFTLAEFLHTCGYNTLGISANTMVGRVTNLDQGFDRFEEVWRTGSRDKLALIQLWKKIRAEHPDKGARQINRLVEAWLEQGGAADRPFFLFINYMETHGPYQPPKPFRDRFLNPDREGEPPAQVNIYDDRFVKFLIGEVELTPLELDDLRSMYDAELAYLDLRLGELLATLRKHGILERALVIVLGDHGENLGEHRMTDHQLCVYDTLLRVPFLLHAPSIFPRGTEVRQTVQLNSLFPTIADILGVPTERLPVSLPGASLLPVIRLEDPGVKVAFSEYDRPTEILKIFKYKVPDFDVSVFDRDLVSGRGEGMKYILTSNGTDELYDLHGDPGEENNLCLRHLCSQGHPLRTAIENWMRNTPAYEVGNDSPTISEQQDREALEKLRSLGYVQ